MRPRKILISGSLGIGGLQTHMLLLCKLLRAEGVELTSCGTSSTRAEGAFRHLRDLGVRLYHPRWGRPQALLTWPLVLDRDFDLLYCIGQGRMHARLKAHLRPGGLTLYHEIIDCPGPDTAAARVMGVMDGIIANSQRVAEDMRQRWPEKPLRTIPFLTASAPLPEPGPRPPVAGRELRVVYLGRLVRHKRPDRLVKEWGRLSGQAPVGPARLDLFGDDTQPETIHRLRAWVSENNLAERVQLHGAYEHDRVPAILANADLVVLPSEWEGLPLVLIEAMQRGVPVVATDVGGTAELGVDNPDVAITPPDWEAFVARLIEMAGRIRAGHIDAARLHRWTESRYGYAAAAGRWKEALLQPRQFFAPELGGLRLPAVEGCRT